MRSKLLFRKLSTACYLGILIFIAGCGIATESTQMKTSVLNVPAAISEKNTDFYPIGLAVDVTTTEVSTLQMLFVSECNGTLLKFVPGNSPTIEYPTTKPIFVSIKVDGEDCFPTSSTLTSSPARGGHSFFSIKQNVPAGTHKVTVEIKTSDTGAYLNNSTLTVWAGK